MGMFRSLSGMVRVELVSADMGRALDEISRESIEIWNAVPQGDLTLRFWIRRSSWRSLQKLEARKANTLKLIERGGIYWDAKKLLQRPVMIFGMALLLLLVCFVPSRIYFVKVEGNAAVPQRLILEAAAESGIRFGASRREVRSEKMKNRLLSALPELQWAGVNTYGCLAVISVRERNVSQELNDSDQVSSIVAARDGVILSCTATRGDLRCVPGQAVAVGDVLISGFTDCGLTVTATRAEGEIFAQTRRNLTVLTPAQCQVRGDIRAQRTKFSLIIGKKRINFYKGSGIWDASCDKIETRYHLTLPGGFQLPVTLVKEVERLCDLEVCQRDGAELLEQAAASYLKQTMVAGTIVHAAVEVTQCGDAMVLTGEYACTEMIGRTRQEIGDYNGKTS